MTQQGTGVQEQSKAFETVKSVLTKAPVAPVLAYYNRMKPLVVSGDASRVGLGAAIYMQDGSELKPITFAITNSHGNRKEVGTN